MKIKKYEVTDMKEALRQIKQDLGPDAVILTTRKVMKPSGLGLFPRPVLEVTAAVDYDKAATQAKPRTARVPQNDPFQTVRPAPDKIEQSLNYRNPVNAGSLSRHAEPVYEDEDDAYIRSLLGNARTDDYQIMDYGVADNTYEPRPRESRYAEPRINDVRNADRLLPREDETVSYVPRPVNANYLQPVEEPEGEKLSEIINSLGLDRLSSMVDDIGEIKKQLTEMKNSMSEPANISVDLPGNLKDYYTLLLKNGFDELMAYRFLKSIEKKLPELPGKAQIKNILMQELAEIIPVEPEFLTALYKRVVGFIGPTGVGKTTTIAKIAASLVLKYNQRVCLITVDNFRIGAVDQLKTYADIVSIPLYVATSPNELSRLIEDIQDEYDYILLDTTGRSPYDNTKLTDVASYLSASSLITPVLVLSMAANHGELGEMFERYSGLSPAYIIFTKLDETRYFGPLANIPIKKKVPLLLFSTGQGVPDDLEVPDGKKIAKKLLQEIPALWKDN